MAACPWIVPHERQDQDLDDAPNLMRCFEAVNRPKEVSEEDKKLFFGQAAASIKR